MLKVCFAGGNVWQRTKFLYILIEALSITNLRYVVTTPPPESNLRIGFDAQDGSWSLLGTLRKGVKPGEVTMNLANIDSTPEFLEDEVSTILHETLHALGFEHEHQSPARPLIDEAGEY